MLLVVTVVAVGAAALAFAGADTPQGPAPRVEMLADSEGTAAADGQLNLRHTGGPSIGISDLRLVLSSNSSAWSGPVTCPSTQCSFTAGPTAFELGSEIAITTVGLPIRPEDQIAVLAYIRDSGVLVSEAALVASGDSFVPTPPGFDVTAARTDTVAPAQGATILVTTDVTHPEGRKSIARVVVNLLEVRGPTAFALRDDGVEGDLRAGDGTYSGYVPIPVVAPIGPRSLYVQAYDLDSAQTTVTPASTVALDIQRGAQIGPQGPQGIQGLAGSAGSNGTPCTNVAICGAGTSGSNGQPGEAGTPGTAGNNTDPQGNPLDDLDVSDMDPTSGLEGQVVKLTGTGLESIVGVWMSLENANPFIAYAVVFAPDPTVPVGTGLIFAVPDLAEGPYIVTVRRSDGAIDSPVETFQVNELKPTGLSMSPNPTTALKTVTINGANLDLVRSVTLVDNATNYEAGWYVFGTAVRFIVPEAAAPLNQTPNFFTVRLGGDYTGTVDVSPQLQVDPTPAPVIFCPLTPPQGEPFTEITISGKNFVNVRSVLIGGDSLPFVSVSENRIVAITHTGLTLGPQYVTVTTATGSTTSTCQFNALPLKLIPIYDENTFEYVATQTNVTASGSSGDEVDLIVKLKLKNASWSIVASGTNVVPDKLGNANTPTQALSVQNCGSGIYRLTATDWRPSSQYDSSVYNLYYLLTIVVKKGSVSDTYGVTTNDLRQFFVVPANVAQVEVMDDGEPLNGFYSCT